jgi:transposase
MNALEQPIAELTAEIETRVAAYEDVLRRIDTIPGFDRITAWTVLAEIGTDRSVFEDAAHLASWAAVCPGNRESGGKRTSGKTRKGNRYLRRALCQSAWAALSNQASCRGVFRRIGGGRRSFR